MSTNNESQQVKPVAITRGMSADDIASARKMLDELEKVARVRDDALKEIEGVLNKHGLTLGDVGLQEIEAEEPQAGEDEKPQRPPGTRKRAAGKKVATKTAKKAKGGAKEKKLLAVLKKDATVPYTGGRCHSAGRDAEGKMDPKKWRDPTDAELKKWAKDGSLS